MMLNFLIASLPTLVPGGTAPITLEALEHSCRSAMLTEAELKRLNAFDFALAAEPELPEELPAVYRQYGRFEHYLRDRAARLRAQRAGVTVELADPAELDGSIDRAVAMAASLPPDERERALDQLRWKKLEELAFGHDFDFEALCIYRLKLLLLLKYRNCDAVRGETSFNQAAERISHAENSNHQG